MTLLPAKKTWFLAIPERANLAAILILGMIVRCWAISARPLWYDEAFSVLFSSKGPAAMWLGTFGQQSSVAAEEHPLLYYLLLWGWMQLVGELPAAVRLLSVLFGLGTLIISYSLVRSIFGPKLALTAVFLLALAPFPVHYAQEVRMYALLGLFLLGTTWALWMAMATGAFRWWLAFALSAVLAQYTHTLAAVYLVPLALTPLLARQWKAVRHTFFSGLLALVLYLPWLVQLPAQIAKVSDSYWTTQPSPARLITALLNDVSGLPLDGLQLPVALFISVLCLVLGSWQTWRAWKVRHARAGWGAWLAYLAFGPLLLLFLLSQWRPVFVERALLPSGVIFILWLAWAIYHTGLPHLLQWAISGLLLVGFGIGLFQHVNYAGFPYAPYPQMGASIESRLEPGDVVIHSNKLTALPLFYYKKDLPQQFVADPDWSGSNTLGRSTQQILGITASPSTQAAASGAPRVWFIVFEKALQEYQTLPGATSPDLAWLDSHYRRVTIESWGDALLILFSNR